MRRTASLTLVMALVLGPLLGCERQGTPPPQPAEVEGTPSPSPKPEPVAKSEAETTETTKPEPKPPDPSKDAEALVTLAEQLGELHATHAEDCKALAEAIGTFHAEHGKTLAEAPAPVLAYVDAHEPLRLRMRAAMEPVMTASMRCRKNPAFAAAVAPLDDDPEAPSP